MARKTKYRIIAKLRATFGGQWHYSHEDGRWHNTDLGWYVYLASRLAPIHDCDDDTFINEYYRSDTREQIFLY